MRQDQLENTALQGFRGYHGIYYFWGPWMKVVQPECRWLLTRWICRVGCKNTVHGWMQSRWAIETCRLHWSMLENSTSLTVTMGKMGHLKIFSVISQRLFSASPGMWFIVQLFFSKSLICRYSMNYCNYRSQLSCTLIIVHNFIDSTISLNKLACCIPIYRYFDFCETSGRFRKWRRK